MKKCDCLNFCGDDTTIDPYSESCVDYHNRRTAALKWLADYVPVWEPGATHIMRCSWYPVGYLFFVDDTAGSQSFVFSLKEIHAERVRIGKPEFIATPEPEGDGSIEPDLMWDADNPGDTCQESGYELAD